jgi:hypothetical protein
MDALEFQVRCPEFASITLSSDGLTLFFPKMLEPLDLVFLPGDDD